MGSFDRIRYFAGLQTRLEIGEVILRGGETLECVSPALFGDVLIARETASWEEGKYHHGVGGKRTFKPKAMIRTVDDTIGPAVAACVEMASDSIVPVLKNYLGAPKAKSVAKAYASQMRQIPDIKYGMVVSGSSVVADPHQVSEIISRHRPALGLEMEIFGIYTAVQKSIGQRKPSVLGIKGVADFGDGLKHDHIQAHASMLSFYTLLALLRSLYGSGHLEAV
jgi:nucleoside phosphorylase